MKTFKYIAMTILFVSVVSLDLLGGTITLINKSNDKALSLLAADEFDHGFSFYVLPGQKITRSTSDLKTALKRVQIYSLQTILEPEQGALSYKMDKEYRLENMPQWKKLDKGTNFDFEIIYDPASKKALDFHNTMGDVKKSKVDKERSLKFS